MSTKIILFVALGLMAGLSSCKNKNQSSVQAAGKSVVASFDQMPPDFEAFYKQFHADSLFQMEHTIWPLEGDMVVQSTDSAQTLQRQNVFWTREEWSRHLPVDFSDGTLSRTFELFADLAVIEKITDVKTGYGLERRFGKQSDDSWALIYYSSMQQRK